jgi:hypothetical protein
MQTATADEFAASLMPLISAIQNAGANTLEAITSALNERGVRPARGTRWYVSSVVIYYRVRRSSLTFASTPPRLNLSWFYRREFLAVLVRNPSRRDAADMP